MAVFWTFVLFTGNVFKQQNLT